MRLVVEFNLIQGENKGEEDKKVEEDSGAQ